MIVMMNGLVVGEVSAKEYSVQTLEAAGFKVIIKKPLDK